MITQRKDVSFASRSSTRAAAVLLLTLGGCSLLAAPERRADRLRAIEPAALCVTEGEVKNLGGQGMEVESPAMRAVVAGSTAEIAVLRFIYEGPSAETSPLADGEVRRQAGLKLRAEDTCNVLYVMWRFEPESRIAVQVKQNPGKHHHAECGDGGYVNVTPTRSEALPAPAPGEEHVLQARLDGDRLEVSADRKLVWEGSVGASSLRASAPIGIRTDNARLRFELAAIGSGSASDCARYADR